MATKTIKATNGTATLEKQESELAEVKAGTRDTAQVSEFALPVRAFAFLLLGQVCQGTLPWQMADEKIMTYLGLRSDNQVSVQRELAFVFAEMASQAQKLRDYVPR